MLVNVKVTGGLKTKITPEGRIGGNTRESPKSGGFFLYGAIMFVQNCMPIHPIVLR